ncbi:DUF5793 family protein [Halorhabdus sp. CUG00001]|uniref:DUF5793 family protein n=1 Tax=Halorhabdus sp. CUG00001 TaxID=2600297 RepID=UPI00131B86E7|nr:DUF5793 family protein [Halorhabdus sp. CUG00001]
MKREHFSLTVAPEPEESDRPTLHIAYDGPTALLREQLHNPEDEALTDDEIDVAFRLQDDTRGVLSIADRHTGAFVFELEADLDAIDRIVQAAEADDERYRIVIETDGDAWTYDKETLLVYGVDGQLLRTDSLIPGSVEL